MGTKRMRVVAIFSVLVGTALLAAPAGAGDPARDAEVVVEQNLFHPSRAVPAPPPPPEPKAPAPVAAPAPPPPPPPPKFVLSGVVIQEDRDTALALLQEPEITQNKVMPINRGEQVGSYRLTEVQPDRVVLRSPTDTLTVLLHDPNKPKPPLRAAALVPRGPSGEVLAPGAPQVERRARGRHGEARRGHGAEDQEVQAEDGAEAPPSAGGRHGRGGRHGSREGRGHGEGRPSVQESPLSALPSAKPQPGSNPFLDALRGLQLQQGQTPGQGGE